MHVFTEQRCKINQYFIKPNPSKKRTGDYLWVLIKTGYAGESSNSKEHEEDLFFSGDGKEFQGLTPP